jgi:predicted nucleotidyltransferase
MTPRLTRFLEEVQQDEAVLAVILFGSRARGDATPASDTDLCLVLPFGKDAAEDQVTVRMRYLKDADLDLRIFQQLPLYVRRRVLKEGVVLVCRDFDALYAMAYRTAQAFEDFKRIYRQYLEQVAHVGP